MQLTRDQVEDALREAGIACDAERCRECDGAYAYWDYSGRGMFGRECFGVVGRPGDATRFLIELSHQEDVDKDDVLRLAERTSTDDMGLDLIAYWPDLAIAETSAERRS